MFFKELSSRTDDKRMKENQNQCSQNNIKSFKKVISSSNNLERVKNDFIVL